MPKPALRTESGFGCYPRADAWPEGDERNTTVPFIKRHMKQSELPSDNPLRCGQRRCGLQGLVDVGLGDTAELTLVVNARIHGFLDNADAHTGRGRVARHYVPGSTTPAN